MMRLFKWAMLVIFLMVPTNSYAKNQDPFNVIQEMFAAFSAFDFVAIRDAGTEDFHLLEAGVIWDMDDLVGAFKGGNEALQRRNYFNVIKVVEQGDLVWISYWNRAVYINVGGDEGSRSWLESAILVKVEGMWKIQMLHSTRLRDDQTIPEDIKMIEYVN